MKLTTFSILLISAALTSCSSVTSEDNLRFSKLPDGSSVIYADAEHRMMMVSNPNDLTRFCAEPAPDASISVSDDESEKVGILGKSEAIGDNSSETASSLGGRNSTVLLTRDILYRVCEMSLNTKANYAQSRDLFINALKTIQVLGASQATGQFSKAGTASTFNETLGVTDSSSTSNSVTTTDTKSVTNQNTQDSTQRSPASTEE